MTEKRKPGRQRGSKGKNNLPESELRRRHVVLTLNDAELARLRKKATAAGKRLAVFAREKALK